jgi:hypothetical protein
MLLACTPTALRSNANLGVADVVCESSRWLQIVLQRSCLPSNDVYGTIVESQAQVLAERFYAGIGALSQSDIRLGGPCAGSHFACDFSSLSRSHCTLSHLSWGVRIPQPTSRIRFNRDVITRVRATSKIHHAQRMPKLRRCCHGWS